MHTELSSFSVVEEEAIKDAEIVEAPKRKRRSVPKEPGDEEAAELATMMEEMCAQSAGIAVKSVMKEAAKLKDDILKSTEEHCKAISEKYVKPMNLVMHVKLGDLPAVKLKHRAAKILPELVAQCRIGMAGGNWPLVMGPTGCGKTVAAEQVAELLKLPFEHVNCSEGMSETWLWGRQTPGGFIPGGFWKCYKDGGVFLFDEADAANDNVWLSINTALANGHASNPINGETVTKHKDFVAIAAANTNGKGGTGAYSGRSRLDGATLNRFAMYEAHYDRELEQALCTDKELLDVLWGIREKLEAKKSGDVISTRDIKNAFMQHQTGFDTKKILACLKLRMDKANHDLFVYSGKGKK